MVLNGGWSECHSELYNKTVQDSFNSIKNFKCTKEKVMLACRQTNSNTITLLAWAIRAAVFYNTGDSNTPYNAQGTAWYNYHENYISAWGFAKQGDSIYKSGYCDYYTSGSNDLRLCWNAYSSHSSNNRCGADIVHSSSSREKVVFHAG